MFTTYDRKGEDVICYYCSKVFFKIGHWTFSINMHSKVLEALKNGSLICDCDKAQKELEFKKEIEKLEKQILNYKRKISELDDEPIF